MVNMQIELSERCLKFVRSQAMVFMTALTCLSLTFAPVALFSLGKAGFDYRDPRVIVCFAVIVLAPLVYVRLATVLIRQLRAPSDKPRPMVAQGLSGLAGSILPWMVLMAAAIVIYFVFKP